MTPVLQALLCGAVWAVVIPVVLKALGTKLDWWPDVAIVVVPAVLLRMVSPDYGPFLADLALLGLLYWRVGEGTFDIVIAVFVAHLAALPIFFAG